jgi:ribose transport system substrate-binding protein
MKRDTMKRTRVLLSTLTAAAALAAFTGCSALDTGSTSSTEAADCERSTSKELYFDYPLTSLSVYGDLQRFAESAAEERGYTVSYTADDDDLQKQNTNVQALVTQQVPAIVSYPLEPTSMEALASEARANCTVWVSYAAPLENQDASILFSGLESGKALGEAALAWAAEQTEPVKVLILQNRDLAVGAERDDGLNSVFPGDADNIEIVATQKAGDRAAGEQITREVLQANPDLNMVLSYNDDAGLGAQQAFINAGADPADPAIFIGGQDGSKEGLTAVAEGGLYKVSVAVRIKDIGEAVANVPIDILEGTENTGVNVPPVALSVDSPELAEYLSDFS